MRACVVSVCFVICSIPLGGAQSASPKPAAAPPSVQAPPPAIAATERSKIDAGKEADIRHLLELAGTKALMGQMMSGMQQNIKPLMIEALPAGEYREKLIDLFFEKFLAKANEAHLLDFAVPLYDKYFSAQEVKDLIRFYESPIGQKTITVLPELMAQLQEEGRKWGEDVGRQSMLEVLAEHPDLAKALQDASKTAPAK